MQRYFSDKKIDNKLILSNDDMYHIKKVMRMNTNDLIEVVYDKKLHICKITDTLGEVIIDKVLDDYNEMSKKVIICQSLVNEQKMDFILQKCTELGVYAFYPYKAYNSVIKDNGKSDKKVLRWQKIVKEASEQSKRNIIPEVHDFIDINGLCKLSGDLKIICTVNSFEKNIKKVLEENLICDTIIIVIGPEGGFDKIEEDKIINSGFIPVTLGKRVLRSETASLVILSMINYEWM